MIDDKTEKSVEGVSFSSLRERAESLFADAHAQAAKAQIVAHAAGWAGSVDADELDDVAAWFDNISSTAELLIQTIIQAQHQTEGTGDG